MMTRTSSIGLVALWIFLWDAPSASACTCAVPPVDIAIRQAAVIFTGPLTRMEVTEVVGVLRVTFHVREPLKGQTGRNFIAYTHPFGGSCLGYDFRVGREYVVFAAANDPNSKVFHMPEAPPTAQLIGLCGGTADLQNPVGDGNRWLHEVRQRLKPKG